MTSTVQRVSLLPARPGLSGARLRLFETALALFSERGYDAVSVRDLMREIGQQPGALYGHVPSKQHLLHEIVVLGHEELRDRLREAVLESGSDPVEQLRGLTTAHVLTHLRFRDLARVTHRELRALTPEQQESVMRLRAESLALLRDVVERGVRLGAFSVVEPELALTAIGAMGVRSVEWWTPESRFSAEQVAAHFADYAVKIVS